MARTGDAAGECGRPNISRSAFRGPSGKLKFVLPLGQMVLAVGLLWQSYHWDELNRPSRYSDSPGIGPARVLLICVDGPPLLLTALSFRPLGYGYWMFLGYGYRELDAMFVTCVGIFWYWVALNIWSWRQRNTLLLFKWTPLRIVADLLLMVLGSVFMLFRNLDIADMRWPWRIPSLAFFLFWTFGPLFVFGCDLFRVVRPSLGKGKANRE